MPICRILLQNFNLGCTDSVGSQNQQLFNQHIPCGATARGNSTVYLITNTYIIAQNLVAITFWSS